MEDKIEEWLRVIDTRVNVFSNLPSEYKTASLRESHGELIQLYYSDVSELLALVRVYREANQFYIGYKGAMGVEAHAAEEKAKEIING